MLAKLVLSGYWGAEPFICLAYPVDNALEEQTTVVELCVCDIALK